MTKEQYNKAVHPDLYTGRHEQKYYNVERVLGPAGPVEKFSVLGLEKAAELVYGTWDYEITDLDGYEVPERILRYYNERRLRKKREQSDWKTQ